tara:strand:- start:3336 stop:4172 length:837 start_codon:yes stop_codon:yes gene_type:complete
MENGWSIRKAVFPVAGFGTRFLPATKAMPKELLPILDKPLIQYAAEEAIAAGIDTLIFVTGRNKRGIEDHFDSNYELETKLRERGKSFEAAMVRDILPKNIECIFVRQADQLGLGHAILCAERAVGEEHFAILLADDFLTDYSPGVTSDLVCAFKRNGKSQISVMEVSGEEISNYGVIIPSTGRVGISGLVEKPPFEKAPSRLASIGRYVLTSDIFDQLKKLPKDSNGEIQLADAINLQAKRGLVDAVELKGKRFDCGSVKGFVRAVNYEYEKRYKTE